MAYLTGYEPEAIADLEKLTQVTQARIANKIKWLAENFDSVSP